MDSDYSELFPVIPLTETYYRETGIQRYVLSDNTEIVGVSENTWDEFYSRLKETLVSDRIVASPELITFAGESFEDLETKAQTVNERVSEVKMFSKTRPKTTFIIGTPIYVDKGKPRNGALLISNGEIVGVTSKKSGATAEENKYFEFVAEEPSLIIPGTKTSLLICSDLVTADMIISTDETKLVRTLELSNRGHLTGKNVQLLTPDTTSVLVIACWGVGGLYVKEGGADSYYGVQLRNTAERIMKGTKIKEVVIVDRVPEYESDELQKITPDKPYNGIISMVG